jgi:preprotein translocase subunit SecG
MSYFSGCNNLVTMMNFIISTIFIIFTITLQASTAKAENPLQEFSSTEELVQWAGYGEEKLSTVLVTGTVLCEACLHGENQLHAWPISGFSMFLDFLFGLFNFLIACTPTYYKHFFQQI